MLYLDSNLSISLNTIQTSFLRIFSKYFVKVVLFTRSNNEFRNSFLQVFTNSFWFVKKSQNGFWNSLLDLVNSLNFLIFAKSAWGSSWKLSCSPDPTTNYEFLFFWIFTNVFKLVKKLKNRILEFVFRSGEHFLKFLPNQLEGHRESCLVHQIRQKITKIIFLRIFTNAFWLGKKIA